MEGQEQRHAGKHGLADEGGCPGWEGPRYLHMERGRVWLGPGWGAARLSPENFVSAYSD